MKATTPSSPRRRVVWVERLTAPGLVRLWLESIVRGAEIRFDPVDASRLSLVLFSFLERVERPAGLRRTTLVYARRTANGEALNYRREDDLEAAAREIGARFLHESPDSLKRAAGCFLSVQLMDRKIFLLMAGEASRTEPSVDHEFLIRRHSAAHLLSRPGPDPRIRLDLSPDVFVRNIARPTRLFLRALISSMTSRRPNGNVRGDRDAVWLEYYPADIGGYISRAFWKDGVDPQKFDRVMYSDLREAPCDDANVRRIQNYGFRWIDANRPWTLGPASASALLRTLAIPVRASGPLWLRLFLWEHALWTEIWAAAYRRWRVRLLFQYLDLSWIQDAQARALESAGGAMVGFHWAEAPFLVEPEHLTPFQVYFAWGTNQARRLAGKGHDCREILPCGAWILPNDDEVLHIRKMLANSDFTLAVFDTSVSTRAFVSPDQISQFLLASLRLIAAHPRWKIALKPKGPAAFRDLPNSDEIHALIDRLAEDGRAIVFESTVSPVNVGLACDLSFGIGINSAAVLVGAFGGRCIHWDSPGWRRHPLVRSGSGTVVFEKLSDALKAIEDAAAGNIQVGDFTRWAPMVNHFSDRGAHKRVADWMEEVLSLITKGETTANAITTASRNYRERHGIPADFMNRGEWWETPATNA